MFCTLRYSFMQSLYTAYALLPRNNVLRWAIPLLFTLNLLLWDLFHNVDIPTSRENLLACKGFNISVGMGRNMQQQLHLYLPTETSIKGMNTFFPKGFEIIPLFKGSWFYLASPVALDQIPEICKAMSLIAVLGQGLFVFSKDRYHRVSHPPRGSLSMTVFLSLPFISGLLCVVCMSKPCGQVCSGEPGHSI